MIEIDVLAEVNLKPLKYFMTRKFQRLWIGFSKNSGVALYVHSMQQILKKMVCTVCILNHMTRGLYSPHFESHNTFINLILLQLKERGKSKKCSSGSKTRLGWDKNWYSFFKTTKRQITFNYEVPTNIWHSIYRPPKNINILSDDIFI